MTLENSFEIDSMQDKTPLLRALGERIRSLRARKGITRKRLASLAGISERHMANLELGTGNATILVLHQVAQALTCSLAELIGDVTTSSPEWLMIRELLENRSEKDLHKVRLRLIELFGADKTPGSRLSRIALIGLRGAGKSTLGRMLADRLGYPFIELSHEIEQTTGCSINEIHSLYGPVAYRRYERRALEETIQLYPEVVIATPGGLVSEAATYNNLLEHCLTVWLQATPREHMDRVIAQGDFRPMSGSKEAMHDLKLILEGRVAFYSKADVHLDTSLQPLEETFESLFAKVQAARQSAEVLT
ncbi:anaerobic benzoate catabolism transcriptional regulator [Advenella kashmirensis WT001]|uniref:Shikimate kinase n=1 Tax=Advenella kashmirensis (strain DSM 17095 / LMG 22695 / WT001) TaxID=1036672 RepID=I3UA95_ADVKW|nr:helix-turn-helix transcriptional regulator [Advenella kashmirensis]AFK61933.1 anaerobic benzoate catabolism transcriptional regulator [Advenella kashmirensis WT001]